MRYIGPRGDWISVSSVSSSSMMLRSSIPSRADSIENVAFPPFSYSTEESGNGRFGSSGPGSSYVISTAFNRNPWGRYEGTKQIISNFFRSSNVAALEHRNGNRNALRTNQDAVRLTQLPLITLSI